VITRENYHVLRFFVGLMLDNNHPKFLLLSHQRLIHYNLNADVVREKTKENTILGGGTCN